MNTSQQNPKTRFHWIDRTKGLAILGIVIFHFFQNYPERIQIVNILDRNFARVAYAAVDIFFLMAGFNTSYALVSRSIKQGTNIINNDWKSWLGKRLFRLYPSYFIAVIFTCLFYYFSGNFQINSLQNFILSVLGLAGVHSQTINPGFWFFTVILEAYLLTPIIFIICKNRPERILWLGIIVAVFTKIIASYFLSVHNRDNYLFFLQNNFLGSYIFQLCLGIYWGFIYAEHRKFRKIDFLIPTIIFSGGLIFYMFLVFKNINIIYMLGFDILFTPFLFLAVKSLLSQLEKNTIFKWFLSFLSIMGIYSYQIYLIHQPFYSVILRKIMQVIIHIISIDILRLLVSCLIIIPCLIMYVLCFIKTEEIVIKKLENVMIKKG